MNKMLTSHKSSMPMALMGLCIALAAIGILLFLLNLGPNYGMDDWAVAMGWVAPICCFVAAVFTGVSAYKYTLCFINVFEDHIEGHGMMGKGGMRSQNFYAAKGQYTVNIEGNNYVCVQSGGVGYYLYLTPDQAQQVFALANGMPYQPPVAPPASNAAQPAPKPAPAAKAAAPKAPKPATPKAPKAPKAAPAQPPVQPAQPAYQPPVQPVTPPAPQYAPPQPQYQQPQYQQPQYQAPQYSQPQYQAPVPPQQPAMMIFNCPYCGTKCRVPAGRGPIVITCPRCRRGFNANR